MSVAWHNVSLFLIYIKYKKMGVPSWYVAFLQLMTQRSRLLPSWCSITFEQWLGKFSLRVNSHPADGRRQSGGSPIGDFYELGLEVAPITFAHILVAELRKMAFSNWKGGWEVEFGCIPSKKEKQFWWLCHTDWNASKFKNIVEEH